MKNIQLSKLVLLIGFLCCLFLVSCHKQSKSETETTVGDFKVPETIPLQFTDPEPFEWETITNDTLTTPVTYDLNVDALPSKPFELNTFKPLKSPMKEYDLDWDSYRTGELKFDSVPFTVTKAPIKKPTITKMKPPGNMDGTHVNLLQLSTNEGLPSNDVTSFLETEDGAIWIGSSATNTPLTYYDGENAFVYDYPGVYKMTFDHQGKLWLVSPGPRFLTVLDFKNDTAYKITMTDNFTPFDILCDHTGTIYLNSLTEGFYAMDAEMKSLRKIKNEGSNKPWKIFEDSKNNLWLSYQDGLSVLDPSRKEFRTISNIAEIELNSIVWDIKEDANNNIWLSYPYPAPNGNSNASSSVLRIAIDKQIVSVLGSESGYTITGDKLEEDAQGNLWIFGSTEAFILNKNKDASKTIALNATLQGSLRIPTPLKRKDGSIWIATNDKGVVIANEFTLKTEYFDDTRGLVNNEIWEIEEDSRGELWLGTAAGINIIDLNKNFIKTLSFEQLHGNTNTISFIKEITPNIYFINTRDGFSILDRKKSKLTSYAKSGAVFGAGIAIINEHTFAIYANTGLYVYNIENNSFKKVVSKNDPDILIAGSGSILFYDKEILWIPTMKGLAKVNLKTNTIRYLREEQGLSNNNVSIAKISNEGELWLATANGINILNLEQNTLTSIKKENGLYPTDFYDLTEKGGMMYAASGNGLIAVEKATAKTTDKGFYNFNGGLGFKSNDYLQNSPKFLKNGQFWSGVTSTSSEFRLMVLNTEPKIDSTISAVQINNMFVMDENPGFGFNLKKDSTKVQNSTYASTNSITWDSVKRPYNLPQGLVLPYDQNSISFSYGSNDIFNRDKLNYRFILDGEDEDWSYAANATKTKNYYNLKPGNYTFKVAVRNSNWSVPDILSFEIKPPWWQTWWAYLLFGLIIASIMRVYIVFRARKLTKENRILEERVSHRTVQLKTKIDELKSTQSKLIQSEKMASLGELTAGIAHEIQNPLNFVNNFSEVNKELLEELKEEIDNGNYDEVKALAKDVSANEDKIIFHGKRADGIVKGMLQHSRSSTGQKEMTNINTLSDEYLRLAYHGLRAKDKSFNATLNTDFDDTIGKINIVPQDMGRVILNLITNAFYVVKKKKEQLPKGYEPTVSVTTKKQGNMVLISVTDNGNGVPKEVLDKIFQPFFTTKPSGEGTGLGLSLSYDIVKVHGGELTVETKQGEGTTFTISLPMN